MRCFLGATLVLEAPPLPIRREAIRLATFKRKGRVSLPRDRDGRPARFPYDPQIPYLLADTPDERARAAEALSRGRLVCTAVQNEGYVWLPRGLLHRVRALGVPLEVEDRRLVRPQVVFPWRSTLDADQYQAVADLVRGGGGMLVAPAGGGKTRCGMALCSVFKQPTAWIVHTKDLAEQAFRNAFEYWGLPRNAVGIYGMGRHTLGTHLTICMAQTLQEDPQAMAAVGAWAGGVVFDECHHLSAATRLYVANHLPAALRCGLTATAERTDALDPIEPAILGPHRVDLTQEALVKSGRLLLPEIHMIETGYQHADSTKWSKLQRGRAENPQRNWLVASLAQREKAKGGKVAILVDLIPHAQALEAMLTQQCRVPAKAIIGAEPGPARKRAYDACQAGRLILICTRLFDEGVDLPKLDCLILAAPGRSAPRLIQQVGRVMRNVDGKRQPRVWDLCDMSVPAFASQAKARLAVYREKGWPIAA